MKTDAHTGIKLNDKEKKELEIVAGKLGHNLSSMIRMLIAAFLAAYRAKGNIDIPLQFRTKTDIRSDEILLCARYAKTMDELKDLILTVVVPGYPLSFDSPIQENGFHEKELTEAIGKRLEIIRRK
jgi:hypothetical protein